MQDNEIVYLYLDDIIPNRFQPREVFDDEALKELAISIKEHGVIQPIIVRKVNNKYEIIAGERRYKASTMAGLTKIPAIIKNLDDKESSKVALIENLQRKDLTPIEEARTYQKILDLEGNMTQDQLAHTMGKTQSAVSNKLRLLSLPEEIQQALLNEQISERHARSLLNLNDKNQQVKLLEKIISSRMTVKELEKEIKMLREQSGIGSFGVIDSIEGGNENNNINVASSYSANLGQSEFNPTAVDINRIRETSFDIKPEEKPTPNIDELMKPTSEIANNFKFVPSTSDGDNSTTGDGVFNAKNFFGVSDVKENSGADIKAPEASSFIQNTPFNVPKADNIIKSMDNTEEADGFFGNIPSIGGLPGFNANNQEKDIKPFDFGVAKDLNVSNNSLNTSMSFDNKQPEQQKTGNIVSKFLTDIPSLQANDNSIGSGINNVAMSKVVFGNQQNTTTDSHNIPMQDNSRGLTLGVSPKPSVVSAAGQFRELVKTIENQGFTVNIEELDLMNEYQILIKINK